MSTDIVCCDSWTGTDVVDHRVCSGNGYTGNGIAQPVPSGYLIPRSMQYEDGPCLCLCTMACSDSNGIAVDTEWSVNQCDEC